MRIITWLVYSIVRSLFRGAKEQRSMREEAMDEWQRAAILAGRQQRRARDEERIERGAPVSDGL